MGSRHAPDPEFVALVDRAKSKSQQRPTDRVEPIAAPFAGGTYLDPDGRLWLLRAKGALEPRRMQRLLHDPAVTVVHQYLWDPIREIKPAEREAFWAAAVLAMATTRFSTFVGAEYVDQEHHHLLYISETC
jgi:hypothetical protein